MMKCTDCVFKCRHQGVLSEQKCELLSMYYPWEERDRECVCDERRKKKLREQLAA